LESFAADSDSDRGIHGQFALYSRMVPYAGRANESLSWIVPSEPFVRDSVRFALAWRSPIAPFNCTCSTKLHRFAPARVIIRRNDPAPR